MPGFADLLITASPRITMEEDFTFDNKKGELAHRIRSDYLGTVRELLGLREATVSIDRDGDVAIGSEKGRFYIAGDAIFTIGEASAMGPISKGQGLEQTAAILDELRKSRAPLKAIAHQVRLFLRLQFNEPVVPQMLQGYSFFAGITTSVDSSLHGNKIKMLRWYATYYEQRFVDTMELTIQPSEFQMRYNREGRAEEFPTFREFASSAEFGKIAERIRPFVEPLIFDPSKLRGLAFAQ